jgi:hypothetical protein
MLGGDIGKHLGGMASKLGGWIGGALGKAMPVIGEMLGSLVGPLVDKLFGPTDYEKRVRAANDERAEIRRTMDPVALQRQADMTGRQDLLTGITTGLSTRNDPEYIRTLMGDLQARHDQLNAAMDRYGISWEQLGEKAKQSQINQMAEQFILDFQVLTQAGADVNFVIEKMGASVNEFIQTALRTGTEVPIAMQPMLLKMVEMGTLVDANGVALTDLSSISFAETLTQGIGRVVEAINHLAAALGYALPAAANKAADGMNSAFDRVRTPKVGGGIVEVPEGSADNIDVPNMASGGIVRARPGGTIVRLAEAGQDEAVIPLGGRSGGGTEYMPVTLQMDGATVLQTMVAVRKRLRLHN